MKEPDIIYSDENMIIVNKPAGLAVHGGGSVVGETLSDFLLKKFGLKKYFDTISQIC